MPPVPPLTVTLAAEVAGDSRVMVADEERHRAALEKLRQESPIPKSRSTAARIDNITGDDRLLESAGIFRRRHGREEPVIKLTLGAARSPYDVYGLI